MAENTSGFRRIFSLAPVYSVAQRAIGAEKFRKVLIDRYIRATDGMRVFDLGSGTSDIVRHLPAIEYVGLEPSEQYSAAAREEFGAKVTIVTAGIDEFDAAPWAGTCDLALSIGVLHHLSDEQADRLLAVAATLLKPAGRFVAADPCLHDGQSNVARALITRDRGQHVRTADATMALARQHFPYATVEVRHDLLRFPYTHSILQT